MRFDETVEVIAMLAEKFFLFLETLRSHASDGKPDIVISSAPHIPIKSPRRKKLKFKRAQSPSGSTPASGMKVTSDSG